MKDEYPEVGQLIGIFFSQEYAHEGVDRQVAEYATGRARHVHQLRDELDHLLARELDEGALWDLLRRHGCAIDPPPEDGSYAEFLRHIRRALDDVSAPSDG